MARTEGFIDHFEKDVAFVSMLDLTITTISRNDLPLNAHKGDFIVRTSDKYPFVINRKITAQRHLDICRMSDHYYG